MLAGAPFLSRPDFDLSITVMHYCTYEIKQNQQGIVPFNNFS